MAESALARALAAQQEQPNFPPRMGIDVNGRGLTNPLMAALNMANEMSGGRGLSPAQMDQNQAMRGPLYSLGMREHPEFIGQPREPSTYGAADRRSLAEDLNQASIRYEIWKKQNLGQELTPQDRVTQGFVDVRNPNSLF
jgi:hypothetical protein